MFTPFPDRILIEPFKQESMLMSEQNIESGKVIEVGSKVKFVKKGDTIYFTSWGLDKTPEVDGVRYYVVQENSDFILGKINGQKKQVSKRLPA